MGKVYFNAWSMDVKVEGENVVRNLDLTTHNHNPPPGNSPTWPYIDAAAFAGTGPCAEVAKQLTEKCPPPPSKRGRKPWVKKMCDDPDSSCRDAMKCVLTPYGPSAEHADGSKTQGNCCPGSTPHHVVPKSQFHTGGEGGSAILTNSSGGNRYNADKAPCICAQGESHSTGKHGQIHGETNTRTRAFLGVPASTAIPSDARWPVTFAERVGAEAVEEVTGCPKACTQEQLRKGHEDMGIKRSERIRPTTAGGEAEAGGPIALPPG
jgi:hypothetical protein